VESPLHPQQTRGGTPPGQAQMNCARVKIRCGKCGYKCDKTEPVGDLDAELVCEESEGGCPTCGQRLYVEVTLFEDGRQADVLSEDGEAV